MKQEMPDTISFQTLFHSKPFFQMKSYSKDRCVNMYQLHEANQGSSDEP
jgi:hypothetical protein